MGQISTKYFFKLYRHKIFAASFESYIQLVLKTSFTSFLQPAWIETDSIVNASAVVGCVQLVPNIYQKWRLRTENVGNAEYLLDIDALQKAAFEYVETKMDKGFAIRLLVREY